jgi:citrate synthase
VKVETLYAYVSRGLLNRTRTSAGSTFDPLEVERLAERRKSASGGRGRGADVSAGTPLIILETELALIEDDELYYRGVPARDLAAHRSFEDAAWFLLTGTFDARPPFEGNSAAIETASAVVAAMPVGASRRDLLQVAAITLGITDPLRATTESSDLPSTAAALIGGMLRSLPALTGRKDSRGSTLPEVLWARLTHQDPTPAGVAALNTALILLMEHDLAPSTLAARAAASARASPYAVVATGLAALDSALHGRAGQLCRQLIEAVLTGTRPEAALASVSTMTERGLPGFGHRLYSRWDPRARQMLEILESVPRAAPVLLAVDALRSIVERRIGRYPNADLALAALSIAADMLPTATDAIFGVARSVGWLAHAADEYDREPLRLRPSAQYVGP